MGEGRARSVGCWQLVVVVAVMVQWFSSSAVASMSTSVTYVDSQVFGDFLVADDTTLSDDDAYASVGAANQCECKVVCWSHVRCVAVAAVPAGDGRLQCLLSDHSPLTSTLEPHQDARYFFWTSGVPGEYYGVLSDGLLYLELNKLETFAESKKLCAKIPGHRLGIYKTPTQFQVMLKLYNKKASTGMFVDLRKTSDGSDRVWGDNTTYSTMPAIPNIFDDTASPAEKPAYTVWRERFHDKMEFSGKDRVVCQANPFGVQWQ